MCTPSAKRTEHIHIPLAKNGCLESMNLPFQKKWSLNFQGDENSWTFPNERFSRDFWWSHQAELHLRNQRITLQSLGAQDGGCDDDDDVWCHEGLGNPKKKTWFFLFRWQFFSYFWNNLREILEVYNKWCFLPLPKLPKPNTHRETRQLLTRTQWCLFHLDIFIMMECRNQWS